MNGGGGVCACFYLPILEFLLLHKSEAIPKCSSSKVMQISCVTKDKKSLSKKNYPVLRYSILF